MNTFMNTTMKILTILSLLFLSCALNVLAQHTESPKGKVNYKKHPHWIQMMDDPNVNYFEAVKAFDEFWKDREEPEEEEHKSEKERSIFKRIFISEKKEKAESYQYVIQFKKFKQWKRDAQPYVQSDGSILSKEEQMKIWKESRK
jgi:hypothetical protein